MDPLEVEARYDEIEFARRADKAEAHEALGRAIPAGDYGRVMSLKAAAEHWMMRGENDRARVLLEEIQDEPPEGEIATRATQLQLAFAMDDGAWAAALAKQLLSDFRADLVTVSTCHYVATCSMRTTSSARRTDGSPWGSRRPTPRTSSIPWRRCASTAEPRSGGRSGFRTTGSTRSPTSWRQLATSSSGMGR